MNNVFPGRGEPIVLDGPRCRLELLDASYAPALAEIVGQEELWDNPYTPIPRPGKIAEYIDNALVGKKEGTSYPFVILCQVTKRVVGTTRFQRISLQHKRLQIGSTWIGRQWQRKRFSTETKLLLLDYAFTHLASQRVEFMADAGNQASRAAIESLGATFEGVLRRHLVTHGGKNRDSAIYSVISDEWPVLKQRLVAKLASASGSRLDEMESPGRETN